MHILHTVPHTFPVVSTRRICFTIISDCFLYSYDLNSFFPGRIFQGENRSCLLIGVYGLTHNNSMYTLQTASLYNCYLTNRFQVAVLLFSNRSQMTPNCGKNKKVAHKVQPSVSLMFLPHFDILCDLLLNRHTATWNLFVLYNKEFKKVLMMTSSIRLSSDRS